MLRVETLRRLAAWLCIALTLGLSAMPALSATERLSAGEHQHSHPQQPAEPDIAERGDSAPALHSHSSTGHSPDQSCGGHCCSDACSALLITDLAALALAPVHDQPLTRIGQLHRFAEQAYIPPQSL